MVATKEFHVKVRQRECVVPWHHLIEKKISLSNLDMLLPPEDVGVFFCYKKSNFSNTWNITFGQKLSTLKLALAKVLVHFYVFSSKLIHNSLGEIEINCDNQGVEFIEAYADVELIDLNFYNPSESVEGKLLPKKQKRVLSVQATEFKCGGMVLGCIFDHRVADAYSANMFFVSWAEISNSNPISIVPCLRKSLLKARNPCSYYPSLNDMYVPISSLTPTKHEPLVSEINPLISRIYKVHANEIRNLQSHGKGTKFESFSALLWMLISRHASTLEHDQSIIANSKTCKIGIVVDGRTRLANNNAYSNKKRLINCYFGNVLSLPYGEKTIGDLNANPLDEIVQEVRKCLNKATRKDHFEDLIDWVEAHRPEPCLAKIYGGERGDGPAFVVSSGQQFPVSKVDFGWGKPVFGSYHFPWSGNAGYVMPMPSCKENGDWIVYMLLTEGQLKFIENEASHVFKPFKLSW